MRDELSACDTCPVPGHCCRYIQLNSGSFPKAAGYEEAAAELQDQRLPFRPLFRMTDGRWVLWCPNLDQRTGRCNDYENRPFACSDYEPGTDPLCVLFEPFV